MTSLYGFRGGPTYRAGNPRDRLMQALDQPMSIGSTFFDQTKGGALESPILGTAIRDATIPDGGPLAANRFERPDQFKARRDAFAADPDNKVLNEDAYKASPYYRERVPWDASMTEDRAAALAIQSDTRAVREFYAEKRPITAFFGNLLGQAMDPINYIPIAGPGVKAAAVAKMGVVKGIAATAALDATTNTALASMATRETRRSFGDDVSWQAMATDIAFAAMIGGAFGTVGGVLARNRGDRTATAYQEAVQKFRTIRNEQKSLIGLNEAIGGLANDGEIRLSPNATEPMARVAREIDARVSRDDMPDDLSANTVRGAPLPVTERPEFKSWFGESKVTDDAGAPLVVYHGGGNAIEAFKPNSDGLIFMTSDPNLASDYAVARSAKGSVYPVYASLKNPLEIDRATNHTQQRELVRQAKEAGHDGIVLKNADDSITGMQQRPTSTVVIAFDPAQIKSKFNTGPFSSADPRIIDASPARPDPIPEGRIEAEARTAKPDDYKALASQYRVDPETGKFDEEIELRQLETEGRLTEEDAADMEAADETYQDSAAYGEALRTAVGCLL